MHIDQEKSQIRNTENGTALMCAARNGHSECARLLLDAGADKNAVVYTVRDRGCICLEF